ncbi:FAD-dependent monooxygenase [Streptomyces sp. NPDC093252]|uniref:FAD-dependent monooxygenase n=1 Tax=Streptomyces sp. NPDC093252 TaxID=3154980 RepID=UPI00344578C7
MPLKVLVSGASVAGPALALWLARYGAEVTVVERAPALRRGGQLVDLRGVSRESIRRLGVDAEVRAAREASLGMSFVDHRNRRRGELRAEHFGGDGPVAEIEILRGKLSEVLHRRCLAHGVTHRFGDSLRAVRDTGTRVEADFRSGHRERYDVVVGADGLHSELRRMLFGPDQGVLHHLGTYVSFWTADNHLGLKDWTLVHSEPGRTIGMRSILDNTKVMAFFGFRAALPSHDHRDPEAQRRIVRAHAAGMGWEAPTLLTQMETADDFFFDTCSQVRLPSWSTGRVGLVGDAAYCTSPLSGHGATVAVVGAHVLAGELARTPDDPAGAFARYEGKLRPWLDRIQRSAPGQGRLMTPETPLGIQFRDQLVRLLTLVPAKDRLLAGPDRTSNAFELDDYSDLLVAG